MRGFVWMKRNSLCLYKNDNWKKINLNFTLTLLAINSHLAIWKLVNSLRICILMRL